MFEAQQLFFRSDLTLADFGGKWIGPKGIGSNPVTLDIFDLRLFKSVHIFLHAGVISGGTSPSLGVRLWGYDSLTPHPGASVQNAVTELDVGSGTGGVLIAGESGISSLTNSGATNINLSPLTVTHRFLFGQLTIFTNGSPTSMTGTARLAMYGIR